MPVLVENQNLFPLTLPYPMRGVLRPKQRVALNMTPAEVHSAFGGESRLVGVGITEIPTQPSYSDGFYGGSGGSVSKRYTLFGAQINTINGDVPAGIDRVPVGVVVEADVGDVFAYKDAAGVVISISFLEAQVVALPQIQPRTIETTTTVTAVTVIW